VKENSNVVNKKPVSSLKKRISSFLTRRPHRSFRLTRRRDYNRSLKLPGYFKFTNYVRKTIWQNRKIFLILALIYAIITALMVGIASQDTYKTLTDTLRTSGGSLFVGAWGEMGKASLLFLTALTGGMNQNLTDIQQVYAVIIILLTWLTSVWLLRNILAGHKVKVRDGLYNASAPILSTFIVALLLIVQLLPFALALIGYSAASSSGLLTAGVEAMLFWIAAGLLCLLSLYWITSTIFALIIITLPGMYPYQAIKTAGDLVVGRRLRILLRFLWMALTVVVGWAVVMIPIILFDAWIKSIWSAISWIPIVPVTLLVLSAITIIWVSSYVYLLYRKVIADDANPA
jgi:hypothetical protein